MIVFVLITVMISILSVSIGHDIYRSYKARPYYWKAIMKVYISKLIRQEHNKKLRKKQKFANMLIQHGVKI